MTRITVFLITLFLSNTAIADIYKLIDASGRVTYTNMQNHHSDSGRQSLAKLIIKTPENHFKFRENSYYPTIFHSFKEKFGKHTVNKSKFSNLIANAAYKHGVEEKLVHAVIQTESAYNANAISHA